MNPEEWFDHEYWEPGGVDINRWGRGEVARGCAYKVTGAEVAAGTAGVRRSITSGRKSHRGMASDDLARKTAVERP